MSDTTAINLYTQEILTTNQVRLLIDTLKSQIAELYLVGREIQPLLQNNLPTAVYAAIEEETHGNFKNPTVVSGILADMIEELESTQPVTLITALPANIKTLKSISKHINTNQKTHKIIKEEVDPSILGGFILSFNGEHHDFSVRRKISNKNEL